MPVQVSSLSSDRGSTLRSPPQNSPRVASKWDINITKLNATKDNVVYVGLVRVKSDIEGATVGFLRKFEQGVVGSIGVLLI
ncbi:hypothetical protein AVEN_158990-1 [Araneus ventricosus]|uniref:Uncharacterized protein n=1 Tax=Araneus ventricosus TaxID=182803 RepID=A0A4Y2B9J5_ARAVE|nr:hypothetical protein AVEN_158990-1 [Araneus ventricosus]